MATITGSSIISRAATLIQDATGVRWPRPELLDWLNDGQRELVLQKPEVGASNMTVSLTAGTTKQTLPSNAVSLIDVIRNIPNGDAIRIVSREVLDAQRPGWHRDANPNGQIVHFSYDPRDPKTYYVYPQANAGSQVEAVISISPSNTTDSGAVIGVDDIYANALLDYVLYRAYSKDAEYAQNTNLAVAHYTAFANSIGVKTQNELSRNPNLSAGSFNPNVPGAARI